MKLSSLRHAFYILPKYSVLKAPMKNAIERISGVAKIFGTHFRNEMLSSPGVARDIEDVSSRIRVSYPSRMLSKIYQGLQFGDFLISRIVERRRENKCSEIKQYGTFFSKAFRVPQYYGGIRQGPPRPGVLTEILNWITGLCGCRRARDCVKDYEVLEQIQDRHVPAVLLELFSYGNLRDIALPEIGESLKKLRSAIFENRPKWMEKKIVLDDLRQVEVEGISVKNLKKTVRCAFEFSTLLRGKDSKMEERELRQHFSSVLEFVKENGMWKAASFTFSEF